MKDLGLEATTFQPFRDFEGMPAHLRSKAMSRAANKFDVMEQLGAGNAPIRLAAQMRLA